MIFAMDKYTSNITKWFPRPEVPGHTLPNGNHIVALRGVLTNWSSGINYADPDISMTLQPGAENLDIPDLDPSQLFRVGDILTSDLNPFWDRQADTEPDRHVWIATPQFHMELCGWPPINVSASPGGVPAAWTQVQAANQSETWWAFDVNTIQPLNGKPVVVYGVLITDEPHLRSGDKTWSYRQAAADWSGVDFVGKTVLDASGKEFLASNPARWTEIHPFDSVVADPNPPTNEALIGVAVCARTGSLDPAPLVKTLDETITCPVQAPSAGATFTVRQYLLPDTYLPSITAGPTVEVHQDGTFRISVTVQGDPFQGSAGRFAAIYRMSWEKQKESKELPKEKDSGEKVQKDKETQKESETQIAFDEASSPDSPESEGTARVFIRPDERPPVGSVSARFPADPR